MPTTNEIEVRYLDSQYDFLQADERQVLYSGGVGSGKSTALVYKLLMRASIPGAIEGLCRKTNSSLENSTLRTLLKALPEGSYHQHQGKQTIKLQGGGEIIYFGVNDPQNPQLLNPKIGSMNLTGCAVDEAIELNQRDWNALLGRIREPVEGVSNQLYAATNPGTPSSFLTEIFGLCGKTARPSTRVVHARTAENTFLSPDYAQSLAENYSSTDRARYLDGQWIGFEGLVYGNFERRAHVKHRSADWTKAIVACDDGLTDPFVALRLCMDSAGSLHVEREVYQRGLRWAEKAAKVRNIGESARHIVVDPAAADTRAEFVALGLPVVAANNKRESGILALRARFDLQGDGSPRITIDPSCKELIRELESYQWVEGRDGVAKGDDHALDALRYGVMFFDKRTRSIAIGLDSPLKETEPQKAKSIHELFAERRRDINFGFPPMSTATTPATTRRRF